MKKKIGTDKISDSVDIAYQADVYLHILEVHVDVSNEPSTWENWSRRNCSYAATESNDAMN